MDRFLISIMSLLQLFFLADNSSIQPLFGGSIARKNALTEICKGEKFKLAVPPCFTPCSRMGAFERSDKRILCNGSSRRTLSASGSRPQLRDHVPPSSFCSFSATGTLCKDTRRATLLFLASLSQYRIVRMIHRKPPPCQGCPVRSGGTLEL